MKQKLYLDDAPARLIGRIVAKRLSGENTEQTDEQLRDELGIMYPGVGCSAWKELDRELDKGILAFAKTVRRVTG